MGLFAYEGRKLLRNPLTLVLLAVLLVAGLAQPLYDVYQYRTVNQTYQDRNIEQIIAEYEKMSYSPLLTSMFTYSTSLDGLSLVLHSIRL